MGGSPGCTGWRRQFKVDGCLGVGKDGNHCQFGSYRLQTADCRVRLERITLQLFVSAAILKMIDIVEQGASECPAGRSQIVTMAINQWHKMQRRIDLLGWVAFLVLLSFLLLFSRWFNFRLLIMLVVLGTVLIWYVVSSLRPYSTDGIGRVYMVDHKQGQQIVAGVLGQKGLPYERHEKGKRVRFELIDQGEALVVKVEPSRVSSGGWYAAAPEVACRVTIRPVTAENGLLVESLQAKIDEAFLPRGLPPVIE